VIADEPALFLSFANKAAWKLGEEANNADMDRARRAVTAVQAEVHTFCNK
jgi:hypothetical protein